MMNVVLQILCNTLIIYLFILNLSALEFGASILVASFLHFFFGSNSISRRMTLAFPTLNFVATSWMVNFFSALIFNTCLQKNKEFIINYY
ncbi:TPA: hypothetical protein JAJ32_000667 [Legionella pneumophila]|uniref:Uncharacterized protein n=2 Tax=Legionella pneumophila TaxID=446 RepID=Q5ZVX7_LEGPH|nr:hypothetical protein lpg1311 [Legionella pneumophila subsp. pneumophila str. Philadelphia 1]AEW51515.1 hypothetical protein lp12_1249 [Legionella pneumophila subsp. pneumophila ATCC 43290]PNL78320.1 hypothetical protein A6J41_010365 [Legionella pneumophila subsp. pneumophila]PPK33718.1 hypothetical protein C3927_05780 [Legionella pneumophila]OOD05596.1 hypothetical protein BWO97_12620 [Legionella pneumophila subsp. pneumophila ATCC 43290]